MIYQNNFYKQTFPELPVGCIFNLSGEYFEVISQPFTLGCNKCAFKVERKQGAAGCVFTWPPKCCWEQRSDKMDIVYRKVEDMDAISSKKPLYYLKIQDKDIIIDKERKQ